MPYNFATDSFHTKKLCSRLSSSEVRCPMSDIIIGLTLTEINLFIVQNKLTIKMPAVICSLYNVS